LSEKQKSAIFYSLNTMLDRSSFMGVSDLLILRHIENADLISRSYPIQQKRKQSLSSTISNAATASDLIMSVSTSSLASSIPATTTTTTTISSFSSSNNQTEEESLNNLSICKNVEEEQEESASFGKEFTPILAQNSCSKKSSIALKNLTHQNNNKDDTRLVNEAFQDAVALLENGFNSKMQAEMLVLVDVLHKPANIFPKNSSFILKSHDKRFIGK
jgi:hypothetical protein